MKKFFKKLSFGLALAMVLSCLSPAAGAFAAAKPALNETKKYLHLGRDDANSFDFNIKNKKAGWTYEWYVVNSSVISVNEKNGLVTAEGVGTSKVFCDITDKEGNSVAELSATVVVRDNIETVEITNVPEDNKLKVGEENDFNRSFTTEAGSTKKTSSVTRWTVDKDGATINDKGVFVAEKAGTYTVTANVFQSAAKYTAWAGNQEKYADYVLATDEVEITVGVNVVATAQKTTNIFEIEFDTDMTDSKIGESIALYRIVNDKQVATSAEKISKVEIDKTKVTVTTYAPFSASTTYEWTFGELKDSFVAAKTGLDQIDAIAFTKEVVFNTSDNTADPLPTNVVGYNKDGVQIATGAELGGYLTFEYLGDPSEGCVSGNNIYIYKNGTTAQIKAVFNYSYYDSAAGVYNTIKRETTTVAVGKDADTTVSAIQYAIATAAPADDAKWAAASSKLTVAAGDPGYLIYMRYKVGTATTYTNNVSDYIFESGNTNKLIISGKNIYPISAGNVDVIVKTADGKKIVGAFTITIQPARAFDVATPDKVAVTVGNTTLAGTDKIKVTTLDTLGDAYTNVTGSVTKVNGPKDATDPSVVATGFDDNKYVVDITATTSTTVGAYDYKLTLTGGSVKREITFRIVVAEANTAATQKVSSWRVELNKSSYDIKDLKDATAQTVSVNGYNAAGIKVKVLDPSMYDLEVKLNGNNKTLDVMTISGSALTAKDTGTYVVTAKVNAAGATETGRVAGAYLGTDSYTVTDSNVAAFSIKKTVTTETDLITAVKDAFKFTFNGSEVTNITSVTYYSQGANKVTASAGTLTAGDVYVESVVFTQTFTDSANTRDIKINIGTSIKVQ